MNNKEKVKAFGKSIAKGAVVGMATYLITDRYVNDVCDSIGIKNQYVRLGIELGVCTIGVIGANEICQDIQMAGLSARKYLEEN